MPCSEATLRRRALAAITKRWPQAWVYHPSDRWRTGVPDALMCVEGKFLAMEFKTPHGRLAPIQSATLSAIRRAGGTAWVIRSVEELRDALLP